MERYVVLSHPHLTLDTLTPTHSGLDAAALLCDGPQTEALVSRVSELFRVWLVGTNRCFIDGICELTLRVKALK